MTQAGPTDVPRPSPDGQDHTEARPLPDRPHRQGRIADVVASINLIVTMAYGRAGSLLMQSLFDSHPNVLTLPFTGYMYSLIPPSINDVNRQIDWFIKTFPIIFDTSRGGYFGDVKELGAGNFGPDGDEDLHVCSTDFKKKLLGIVKEYCTRDSNQRLRRKEFFMFIHIAYGLSVRSFDIKEIRYIFYHPHMYLHAEWQAMLEDFPELYLIAMTRDPRQDWTSWKKIYALRMERDVSDVPPIFFLLQEYSYSKECRELANLVERLEHDHVRAIDLEELHIFNKQAMTDLCSWLSIGFHECLLRSTFNGRQWNGNATNGKKVSSLNPNMTRDAWRNEMPEHDRRIVWMLMRGSIEYFGYQGKDLPIDDQTEKLIDYLQYSSELLLFIHCIFWAICLGGKRGRHFRKFWQSDKLIEKMRVVRHLSRIFNQGARLFFELRGNGIDRKITEIVTQQRELLRKNPPPHLFCISR
jgi:hypothetical protein